MDAEGGGIIIGGGADFVEGGVGGQMRRRRRRWRHRIPELFQTTGLLSALWGIRWLILRILASGEKSTNEILSEIQIKYNVAFPRTLLYYHLNELERLGVIGMVGYRETGKGGAPEKVWKLKIRKIIVDIPSGDVSIVPMEE